MHIPMTTFDAIIVSIVALSGIVAFFRGFLREFLSLVAWVGAAVITIYLFPHATDLVKQHVKNEHVAPLVGVLGTYFVALISISIINSIILRYVKTGSDVGLLDNFLGLIFGLLRGAFIVSLSYLILMSAVSKDNPPDWLKGSITRDYLQQGASLLVRLAPQYLNDLESIVEKQKQKNNAEAPDKIGSATEPDYKLKNQKDLDRLFDSSTTPAPAPSNASHP